MRLPFFKSIYNFMHQNRMSTLERDSVWNGDDGESLKSFVGCVQVFCEKTAITPNISLLLFILVFVVMMNYFGKYRLCLTEHWCAVFGSMTVNISTHLI